MENPAKNKKIAPLNAFCVDLEEWFQGGGSNSPFEDHSTWDKIEAHVEQDTAVILDLLDEVGVKGTFLAVGWVAEKYPQLIKKISSKGHEIGCHGYYHRMIWQQTQQEFREEISRSRKVLQDISGQAVTCFRAPYFSIKKECFWAYRILAEEGIRVDVSIVPASRDYGGINGFTRDPFSLKIGDQSITVFPVSVLNIVGKTIQFSGGGYLRLFPQMLIDLGFQQNHRLGRPVMTYIHPRELNPDQPRVSYSFIRRLKHYVGLNSVKQKLGYLLKNHRFSTIKDVLSTLDLLPKFALVDHDTQIAKCTL